MRLTSFHGALLGVAVFFTATLLFWHPGMTTQKKTAPVDETKRGAFFAVTRVGSWIAAAGEHGRILNSTDNGKTWVRGKTTVDQPITCIYLLNDRLGWAAGYGGVILRTIDGGVSWDSVRAPMPNDPPIFAIWFQDEHLGIAVGADSRVYRSVDGGTHWSVSTIETQAHLYTVARTGDGVIWIAGEDHALYNSPDQGLHWQKISPPFSGSFFGAVPLAEHRLLVFGLRGRVSLCELSGFIETTQIADENLFAGIMLKDGRVILAGQRGRIAIGGSKGWPFRVVRTLQGEDISAITETPDALIIAGEFGISRVLKEDIGL